MASTLLTQGSTKQDRQSTHKCNIQARSCNNCFSGKAIIVTYYKCVFVAFGIQHAMHMRHIVICYLHGSAIFFDIISKTVRFSEKKSY
jgi:hypothetical protein